MRTIAIPGLLAAAMLASGCTASGGVDGDKVRTVVCAGAHAIETFVCGGQSSGGESPFVLHDDAAFDGDDEGSEER